MKKLMRVSTVPESLNGFCRGQLKMLSQYYEVVVVSSPLPELKEIEQREGVRCVAVPMERHISLVKDVCSLFRMIRVMRRECPDIVHSMTPKAGLVSMLAAWLCRVPVRMHTYTGLVFPTATGLKQRVLIAMDRLLCLCATYVNPEGQGVANDLRNYRITRKPLNVIGHGNVRGIDAQYWSPSLFPDRMALRKPLNMAATDFVFVFVGRMVGDKGINELVNAFVQLQRSNPEHSMKLLLVGPYEEELDPLHANTLHEIDTNGDIMAVGRQSDIRPYYALADAFVFPSYREGFPNTVLEAGAMNLPSIVTNINGANEIVAHGVNGLIIPPRVVQPLYEAMRQMLTDAPLRRRLASQARELVISRFEQQYVWGELLKTYREVE